MSLLLAHAYRKPVRLLGVSARGRATRASTGQTEVFLTSTRYQNNTQYSSSHVSRFPFCRTVDVTSIHGHDCHEGAHTCQAPLSPPRSRKVPISRPHLSTSHGIPRRRHPVFYRYKSPLPPTRPHQHCQPPRVLRVITQLWSHARGVGLKLGVIPYLNGPRRASWEFLSDSEPR